MVAVRANRDKDPFSRDVEHHDACDDVIILVFNVTALIRSDRCHEFQFSKSNQYNFGNKMKGMLFVKMWKLSFASGRTSISEILTLQNIHYFFRKKK